MRTTFHYVNPSDYNSSAVEAVGISEGSNQVKVTLGSIKSLGKWVSEALVNNNVDYLQLA